MSLVQQGTINLNSSIQWDQDALRFGPDGFRTIRRGKGSHALCLAEAEALQPDGWEGDVTPIQGEPFSIITASLAALDPNNPDNDLVTRWSLDVQYNHVRAEKSQAFKAYITANGGYGGSTFRAIFAAVRQYEDENAWTLYDALANSTQKSWAYDIINGETVREPDAVLRRVNSYPPNTSNTADWVDAGKVFTTSQVTALSDPPSAIIGTLPTTYWLKTPAGADYVEDGRFEVVTFWISGNVETYPSHRYTYKT